MARTDTLTNYLSDVAEAIKTKKGDDTPILASEFDTEIANLPSGGGGLDWSAIGYSSEPAYIQDGYNYALQIKNNWEDNGSSNFSEDKELVFFPLVQLKNTRTIMRDFFNECHSLETLALIDTSNITNMQSIFSGCYSLNTIPQLDTSNVTNMSSMFNNCYSLKSIPQLNTSKSTNMQAMFAYCKDIKEIPQLDTSNVTNMSGMFAYCKSLETIPLLDFSSVTDVSGLLGSCYNIKNLGGFKDLGKSYLTTASANNYNYTIDISTGYGKLGHDSLMNVINNLYDIASAGVQQQTLRLSGLKNQLSDAEKQIAIDKGWQIT